MGRAPSRITVADARQRIRRFASLRAAQRALAPSRRIAVSTEQLAETRELRLRIERLASEAQVPGDSDSDAATAEAARELEAIDAQLQHLASELATQLGNIAFSQLRATLSVETGVQRTEATALLDLCLESESVPSRFLNLIDYLITSLSIGWRDGRWLLVRDPIDVSEKVRQRCWAAASAAPRFGAELLESFSLAARQLERNEDVGTTFEATAAVKIEQAENFFVPDLLRCIVRYNVAARNYYDKQLRLARNRDDALEAETNAATPGPVGAELHRVEAGVAKIQAALRRKMLDAPAAAREQSPLCEIVAAFDSTEIGPSERMAFLHAADDGIMDTVRRTVVLGFLHREIESLREPLEGLGVDSVGLEELIQQFSAELQSQINGLLVDNSYESAQQLSEIRTAHLSGMAAGGRKGASVESLSAGVPQRAKSSRALRRGREGTRTQGEVVHRSLSHAEPAGRLRRFAWLAPVLVLCLIGLLHERPSGPRVVEEMSEIRLQRISRLLQSGYRDHAPDRSIFVGTLAPMWSELPAPSQQRATDKIHDELRKKGVYEVLLYDGSLELQAHYIDTPKSRRRRWAVGRRSEG